MQIFEKSTLVKCGRLSEGIYEMYLKTGAAEYAKPGQFVMVYPANASTILPRPISICEVCEDMLRLVYRVQGKGTREFSLYKEGDLKTAALVAVSALPSEENDRPYVADAENALSKALHVYDSSSIITKKASFKHDLTVADMYFDETGNYLVTIDRSSTVYVWDMEKEECIFKVYADFSSYGDVESTLYANVISDKLVIVRTSSVSA